MLRPPPRSPLFPYTTLFRSVTLHWILMMFNRGTSEPRSAPPAALLNNRPNCAAPAGCWARKYSPDPARSVSLRSEEHTSELQSHSDLVCRLLLEKKKHTRCG